MNELKLIVARNCTEDPNDTAGILRYHEERKKLINGLINELDLTLIGDVNDTAEDGRPREWAELVVALGSAGVFTAMVNAFKVWLESKKIREITIEGNPGSKITLNSVSSNDVQSIAKAVGFTMKDERSKLQAV